MGAVRFGALGVSGVRTLQFKGFLKFFVYRRTIGCRICLWDSGLMGCKVKGFKSEKPYTFKAEVRFKVCVAREAPSFRTPTPRSLQQNWLVPGRQ